MGGLVDGNRLRWINVVIKRCRLWVWNVWMYLHITYICVFNSMACVAKSTKNLSWNNNILLALWLNGFWALKLIDWNRVYCLVVISLQNISHLLIKSSMRLVPNNSYQHKSSYIIIYVHIHLTRTLIQLKWQYHKFITPNMPNWYLDVGSICLSCSACNDQAEYNWRYFEVCSSFDLSIPVW